MRCWKCGKHNAEVTSFQEAEAKPSLGDVSICIGCATPAVFTGQGNETRKPTFEEMVEINNSKDVQRLRAALMKIRAGAV